jgi:hypothetical protein
MIVCSVNEVPLMYPIEFDPLEAKMIVFPAPALGHKSALE